MSSQNTRKNMLVTEELTKDVHPSATRVPTYIDEPISVVGATNMTVQLDEIVATLCAQVVVGEGPYLMGRDWLGSLNPLIPEMKLF